MPYDVVTVLLSGIDEAWSRLRARLEGLTSHEYLWAPVPDVWTVRSAGGQWTADWPRESETPDPPPITTVAWRLWHLGSACFAQYVDGSLGDWPLAVHGREWFGEPAAAVEALGISLAAFCDGIRALGPDGVWQPLGPAWGPYADDSWAALVLHAQDELSHHGGEIALLRDLYLRLGARPGD